MFVCYTDKVFFLLVTSRTIGKASSEMRLYFAAPKSYLLDLSSDLPNVEEVVDFEGSLNPRASYLYGQDIYGDAILASIGYTRKSEGLFHEDITLQSYYRFLLTKCTYGIFGMFTLDILSPEFYLNF